MKLDSSKFNLEITEEFMELYSRLIDGGKHSQKANLLMHIAQSSLRSFNNDLPNDVNRLSTVDGFSIRFDGKTNKYTKAISDLWTKMQMIDGSHASAHAAIAALCTLAKIDGVDVGVFSDNYSLDLL